MKISKLVHPVALQTVGNQLAIAPTIQGPACITGFAQYVVNIDDPFPEGFTVGDIWGGSILNRWHNRMNVDCMGLQ